MQGDEITRLIAEVERITSADRILDEDIATALGAQIQRVGFQGGVLTSVLWPCSGLIGYQIPRYTCDDATRSQTVARLTALLSTPSKEG